MGDVTEGYAPRRTVLDKILVDATVNAGAELREECTLHDLVWEGERVTGIRSRIKGGAIVTERARLVIGADGMIPRRQTGAGSHLQYQARPYLLVCRPLEQCPYGWSLILPTRTACSHCLWHQ